LPRFITPDQRRAALDGTRQLKMARSTHAYVRGNTANFYEWLAQSAVAAALPVGPPIWICGDCHLGNLGPVADADDHVEIQIRDLDQTVIGNPAHDIVRLALSLQTAVRGSDLPGVVSARMIEAVADSYERAFLPAESGENEGVEPESNTVRTVCKRALGRSWKDLARERIEDAKPTIPLGKKYWPIDDLERGALHDLIHSAEVTRLALTSFQTPDDSKVHIHDAAYWRKGCSSLGLLRYAVLIGVENDKGAQTFGLIDVKEAVASVAPAATGAKMPDQPAERVVTGARALSPHLGDRMVAARLMDKSVIVRELLPQDLKIEIEQFSGAEAIASARSLARVVGKAHARQMGATTRATWHQTLTASHSRTLDAPLWLWKAVVDLVAMHEAAYLEHCRIYALTEVA
jgi:uncharacterized protein (DUF2252 family)